MAVVRIEKVSMESKHPIRRGDVGQGTVCADTFQRLVDDDDDDDAICLNAGKS